MKKAIEYFVKYPVIGNSILFLIAVFGLFAFFSTRVTFFPQLPTQFIKVSAIYPGASPEEIEEGIIVDYDENGNVVLKGEYIEGKREGKWIYSVGDTKEETFYSEDMKNGWDRIYLKDGTLLFEGKFIDDNPNGEHNWYWPNGKLKQTGKYIMGIKNGDWKKYDENGQLYLTITYKQGKEVKYDGINVN